MINPNKLSGRIVAAGYSKTRLAAELGMSKNTLCDKVNGKRPFNTNEIILICEKLEIIAPEEKAEIFLG